MRSLDLSLRQTNGSEIEEWADQQTNRLGKIYEVKSVDDIARVHQKYLQNATGNANQQQALKYIGLNFSVFFGEEKERKNHRLDDAQKNKNSKKVDAIGHGKNVGF